MLPCPDGKLKTTRLYFKRTQEWTCVVFSRFSLTAVRLWVLEIEKFEGFIRGFLRPNTFDGSRLSASEFLDFIVNPHVRFDKVVDARGSYRFSSPRRDDIRALVLNLDFHATKECLGTGQHKIDLCTRMIMGVADVHFVVKSKGRLYRSGWFERVAGKLILFNLVECPRCFLCRKIVANAIGQQRTFDMTDITFQRSVTHDAVKTGNDGEEKYSHEQTACHGLVVTFARHLGRWLTFGVCLSPLVSCSPIAFSRRHFFVFLDLLSFYVQQPVSK